MYEEENLYPCMVLYLPAKPFSTVSTYIRDVGLVGLCACRACSPFLRLKERVSVLGFCDCCRSQRSTEGDKKYEDCDVS